MAVDHGLTHVALAVTDVDRSVDFYRRFAAMDVVHRRVDPTGGDTVVWLSDRTRPFVIVLIEHATVTHPLGGFGHLGVGCDSKDTVDRLAAEATAGGHAVLGPLDLGPPVGYFVVIEDPDGHNLELSYGQEVGLIVMQSEAQAPPPST